MPPVTFDCLLAGMKAVEADASMSVKKGKKKEAALVEDLQKQLAASEAETKRLRELVGGEATPKKRKLSKQPAAIGGAEGSSPDLGADSEGGVEVATKGDKAPNHQERKRLQRMAYKVDDLCRSCVIPGTVHREEGRGGIETRNETLSSPPFQSR